ncbi:relaxase/mobilization nuclease domain-containing protein [Sphingobacterium kitahiroshimense]|uniref:Relaxase/mobilization nuclease domain-containing protein n=1 Tax=Sphingobacterium kitahiroshimense TaxID=470446 RepID=A0ABV0BQH1_9SPHI
MIVKILQKSATFKGVSYNTDKIEKDRGELMLVKNFGMLQGLEQLRPQDYINYLEAVSSRSTRTKYPQFHVVISGKGRSHSKEELTDIAQQWMQGMDYGEQPYLLIFHKDTDNNHIHLVSTRVGKDGKKISDSYEKLRAYRVLNRITGEDEKQAVAAHLEKALAYGISTRAQFMMILEAKGYALALKDNAYAISKYGRELARLDLAKIDMNINARQKDVGRIRQIRAIIEKYRTIHDPSLYRTETGYTSALTTFLQEKFGLQVFFHGKGDKPPYGYTLIDHSGRAVYKGGEIMALAELIEPMQQTNREQAQPQETAKPQVFTETENSQDSMETEHTESELSESGEIIEEPPPGDFQEIQWEIPSAYPERYSSEPDFLLPTIDINISDDIDDEAILGRNRRRQRKARTNTR